MKMKKAISIALLSAAMSMGFNDKEGRIKKATQINRNWKEDQDKQSKNNMLEKAIQKRIRKREIKRINLLKSKQ